MRPHLTFGEKVFDRTWNSPFWLDGLVNKLQGVLLSSFSHSPGLKLQTLVTKPGSYVGTSDLSLGLAVCMESILLTGMD